jgi:hypothetical protein
MTELCPVGLAMMVQYVNFQTFLGLGLVPLANLPGSGLPNFPLLCHTNVNIDIISGLDGRRTFSMPGPSPQLTVAARAYHNASYWTSNLLLPIAEALVSQPRCLAACPRCLQGLLLQLQPFI